MIQLQGRALGALEDVGTHGRVHHRRRQQRGVERKLVRQVLPHALVVNRVAEGEVVLAVLLRRHVVHDQAQVQHTHHAQRNRHHQHHDRQQSRNEVVLEQQEQSGANGELTSDRRNQRQPSDARIPATTRLPARARCSTGTTQTNSRGENVRQRLP